MRMMKNRKAQFFIFTAIILIAYSTLLLSPENVVPDASGTFRQVYDNFRFESSAAINNALFEQVDVPAEYARFLDSFISYSKMKKTGVEVFSVLEYGDYVYFTNKMSNPVHILGINETIAPAASAYFLRSDLPEAVLEVRDDVFHENIYKFTISGESTDAKAVLRVKKGSKRQIFVLE
jgi:hypothetical protein